MDSYLLSCLGKALFELEDYSDLLDDLLVPRQVPSGENAGKSVSVKKSTVPLSVAILDVKVECEFTLRRWVGAVGATSGVAPAGVLVSIPELARWLQSQLFVIDEMPWAKRCAEEIIAQARLIGDVVLPPASKDDPEPITHGTVREVLGWVRLAGVSVSRSTVQRWIAKGVIASEYMPDGRIVVAVDDVIDQAQRSHLSDGPPSAVS